MYPYPNYVVVDVVVDKCSYKYKLRDKPTNLFTVKKLPVEHTRVRWHVLQFVARRTLALSA